MVCLGESSAAGPPGADWPEIRHDTQRTGANLLQRRVLRSNVASLKPKWHVRVEEGMRAEPVVANGVVFAGNVSGAIDALRADDGKAIWSFAGTFRTWWKGAPTIRDGILYAADTGGYGFGGIRVAIDASNGNLIWRKRYYGVHLPGAPLILGDRFYEGQSTMDEGQGCQTGDQVVAVDVHDGSVVDRLSLTPPHTSGADVWSAPALDDDGAIYVGTGNPCENDVPYAASNAIVKIGTRPLRTQWVYQAIVNDTHDLDFGATPNVVRDLVVEGGKNGFVYALRRATGALVWKTDVHGPVLGSAATDGARVYVPVQLDSTCGHVHCGAIVALDLADGHVVWKAETKFDTIFREDGSIMFDDIGTLAPVTVTRDLVFAAHGDGVSAYDSRTGTELWRWQGHQSVQAGIVVVDSGVYVAELGPGSQLWCFTPGGR
jgi:outer membrane protein assembly factor BamB